jgi:methionyl-tRNA formyltransferase
MSSMRDGVPLGAAVRAEPRVLAAANGPLGATLLDVLARHDVTLAGVLVGPARTGRPDPCPFATAWADRHGVPAVHVPSWRDPDAIEALRPIEFDILMSLAYDLILPEAVLRLARRFTVNVHRGLAPEFRGCYSTTWSLELGASAVGVTLHQMSAEVDAGAILAQRSIPVAPDLTAAELTPAVERLAVELLDEAIGPLLAGRLEAIEQQGGRSFPHRLPAHELDQDALPAIADRIRALHFPPHPPVQLSLGGRRFQIVEAAPTPAIEEIAGGAFVQAFSSSTGAFAHAFRSSRGEPLVLPACGPPQLYKAADACGLPVRFYRLDDRLEPDRLSLVDACEAGAVVVLPAGFGRPCSGEGAAIARGAGCSIVEDRSAAVLSSLPLVGDVAVVALRPWLDVPDGALLLSAEQIAAPDWEEPDLEVIGRRLELAAIAVEHGHEAPEVDDSGDAAPRSMSRWSQRQLEGDSPLPAARSRADQMARELMGKLGSSCPFTHWPIGAHAHGFPVLWEGDGIQASRPWVAGAAEGEELAARLRLIHLGSPTHAEVA